MITNNSDCLKVVLLTTAYSAKWVKHVCEIWGKQDCMANLQGNAYIDDIPMIPILQEGSSVASSKPTQPKSKV